MMLLAKQIKLVFDPAIFIVLIQLFEIILSMQHIYKVQIGNGLATDFYGYSRSSRMIAAYALGYSAWTHCMCPSSTSSKRDMPAELAAIAKSLSGISAFRGAEAAEYKGSIAPARFYVERKSILFLKLRKLRIPKQTLFRALVLLLQPSMKPLDQGTSMEFRISLNQL